jgi:hypothetical protein
MAGQKKCSLYATTVVSRPDKHDLVMFDFGCVAVVTVHFRGSWQARERHSIVGC